MRALAPMRLVGRAHTLGDASSRLSARSVRIAGEPGGAATTANVH